MHLTVFNGSPRHKKSNTDVYLEKLISGMEAATGLEVEKHYIYPRADSEELARAFSQAEKVLLAFPLYADAMPSGVKMFIEALRPVVGRQGNPELLFFVQCGFPEPFHIRSLERYLLKLAQRLGSECPGCIVKGGGEGVQEMPGFMTRGIFKRLKALGRIYAETGRLDAELLQEVAGPERLGWFKRILTGWFFSSNLGNFWWHKQMRENNCIERHDATPLLHDKKADASK